MGDTIDETEGCDWLATHALPTQSPSGAYLADRSDHWGAFDLETETPNQFGRFEYDVDLVERRVVLDETENVTSVRFDLVEAGLDPALEFELETGSLDGTGDVIVIAGVPALPVTVKRNDIDVSQSVVCGGAQSAPTWCYDPQTQVLQIVETESTPAVWLVTP